MANYSNYCKNCGPDYNYYPDDDEDKCHKKEKKEKKEKHEKHPITIFSCGNGNGLSLPVSGGEAETVSSTTLVVGTVTLDIRKLEKPTVKIDYSSIINFHAEFTDGDAAIRIIFQLSRSCDNGPKIPLANWIFKREVDVAITVTTPEVEFDFADPFSFTWCECHECQGCCIYFVEIIDISTDDIESASITNVGINAQATGFPEERK